MAVLPEVYHWRAAMAVRHTSSTSHGLTLPSGGPAAAKLCLGPRWSRRCLPCSTMPGVKHRPVPTLVLIRSGGDQWQDPSGLACRVSGHIALNRAGTHGGMLMPEMISSGREHATAL